MKLRVVTISSPFAADVGPSIAPARIFGKPLPMPTISHTTMLRVRYSETDQMGTFYNSRPLEWFECGRTELMRTRMEMTYADFEQHGFFLPLVEAHLEFLGMAKYDDLLAVISNVSFCGKARLRFDVRVTHTPSERPVVSGYTVHAFVAKSGRPVRPPDWFVTMFNKAAAAP